MKEKLEHILRIGIYFMVSCLLLLMIQPLLHAQTSPCPARNCLMEITNELAFGLDTANMRLWFNNNQNVTYEATRINWWKGELMESNKIYFTRRNDTLFVSTQSQKLSPLKVWHSNNNGYHPSYLWSWSDDRYMYYLDWTDINDCCSQVQFSRTRLKREGKRFIRWKWLGDYVIVRPESE